MRSRFLRVLHALLLLALAGMTIVAVAALALAWRLSQGPLDVDWAAQRVVSHMDAGRQPPPIAIGGASVEWTGFEGGSTRELVLHLRGVTLQDSQGHEAAAVRAVDVNVAMGRLLLGQVVLRDVAADGLTLRLVRGLDGKVGMDLPVLGSGGRSGGRSGEGDSIALPDQMQQLARPTSTHGTSDGKRLQWLEQLRRVHLTETTLVLDDRRLGATWQGMVQTMDLQRQPGGGIRGSAAGTLALGDARATLALQAQLAAGGGTSLQLEMAPLQAATATAAAQLAGIPTSDSVLAPLLDAPVQARATLDVDAALHPTAASIHVQVGAGQLRLAGAPISFDRVALEAHAGWATPAWTRPTALDVTQALVVLHAPGGPAPSTVTATLTATEKAGRIDGTTTVSIDRMAFVDLQRYWPVRLGGHTRPFLTGNLVGGTARDGTLTAVFQAPGDLSAIELTALHARLVGEDATITWLLPVPPIEHAQALLTITEPDTLDIAVSTGRQGAIALSNGTLHFIGMAHKDQFLTLGLDVDGSVADVVTLLKNPRLQLLSRKPIPMKNPAGQVSGHLVITLPMKDHLQFEDVGIDAKTHLTHLHLGGLVAGHDLDQGDVQLAATQQSLHASGKARLAGIPSDLTVTMDFRNGPPNQVVQAATARGRATLQQLRAAGLDPGDAITSGSGRFDASYAQLRDLSGEVKVSADLSGAGLAVAGWRKPPGPAATVGATLTLHHDQLAAIDALHASGPGLDVEGRAELIGGVARRLVLSRIVLGPTQASGQILFPGAPGEPIHATLDGPVLDMSTQLTRKHGTPPTAADTGTKGTPFVADLRFARVVMARGETLRGVSAHAESDGTRLVALQAQSTGPEHLRATIRREPGGRAVELDAADGGFILRALDVVDVVRGGRLRVAGQFDDRRPGSPLAGTATMSAFQVDKLAILGKLLQAVTVYGVADALTGRGIAFTELHLPFRWEDPVLQVGAAQAFSASLGLTAKGRIDTARQTIDLSGTVVPAYAVNSLLGRIPLVGRLFSAERGGGLVAVDYAVRGALASPSISVNPLSALTPGFLRGLFHLTD